MPAELKPGYSVKVPESPPPVDYSDAEIAYRARIIKRMEDARTQRSSPWAELNEQDVLTYYESNAKAANSYVRPKLNKDDTRIVTGTTEEKTGTLVSALLNYNLSTDIVVFDEKDMEVQELGRDLNDMLKKSREIEDFDELRPLVYKEMLDQGDVFVEDYWAEEFTVDKETPDIDWETGVKLTDKGIGGKLRKSFEGCRSRILRGPSVLLGNYKQFFIQEQPFIATVTHVPYDSLRTSFASWERWENVPRVVVRVSSDDSGSSRRYDDWSLLESTLDTVEVVKYYDRECNEFMLMFNGVMMLPMEFPLTAVSPSGMYPIAKGSVNPISSEFALSKSVPAKTKVDQQVLDEMLKLIVLKTQQSFKPPMANNTKRTLSPSLWSPGTLHRDIDVSKLVPIMTPTGVTIPEFNAFQLIKSIVDEKSTSPVFGGNDMPGSQTATQIVEMKKQQMMKLGLTIWGVISLEKQLAWLRAYNIMANWTRAVDSKVDDVKGDVVEVYRTVSVDTTFEDGKKGRKIIEMDPEMANLMEPENVMAEEEFLSEQMRMPVRKVYYDPTQLQAGMLKNRMFITVVPTEKDTSELKRAMFQQSVGEAMQLFGPQSLNMDYVKERWAIHSKEDPKKFFAQNQPAMPMEGAEPQAGNALGAQLAKGLNAPAAPSLNTLVNA